jgi:hypothetical protein
MTVCVAAICSGNSSNVINTVIGASDRLITYGDIKYEPDMTKVINISRYINAMIAGDDPVQTEIYYNVISVVNSKYTAEPNYVWPVKEVADLWSYFFIQYRRKVIQNEVLSLKGLNWETYISRQKEMIPEFLNDVETEVTRAEGVLPTIETIICGVDHTGVHIYTVHNERVTPHDKTGFAAIGSGHWQANSHFMAGKHTPYSPFAKALIMTYSAKKRAEISPHIGGITDMFCIDATIGILTLNQQTIGGLDRIYRKADGELKSSWKKANKASEAYVKELIKAGEKQAKKQKPSEGGGKIVAPSNEGAAQETTLVKED